MRKSKVLINQLKNDLDNTNNFIDYFLVIGINHNNFFNDFMYENDCSVINNSGKIKPEIISMFPPVEKSTISIDDNIIKVSFSLISTVFLMASR